MKFVHMADMHLDTPFIVLTNRADLGDIRRLDQRKAFKKIIEYIKQNEIKYLFIAGDLYDNEHIKLSTIEFINNLFKQIQDTHIFITPGNHDPYITNSFYAKYKWSENVHIFTSEISIFETEEADIYGCGFDDFYYSNENIEKIEIKNKNKINILITHGTLNGSNAMERDYNPISKKALQNIGFNYVALGHIHKLDYNTEPNQTIVYPGSTVSLGFDELGQHGVIVGNIEKSDLQLTFMPVDEKEFKTYEIDVTNLTSMEDIAEKINELQISENVYYKIELIGRRKFDINKNTLIKLIQNLNIIKIKDLTKIGYEIEKIANDNTLKGLFAKEILQLIDEGTISKEKLENIFEIGYEVLEK